MIGVGQVWVSPSGDRWEVLNCEPDRYGRRTHVLNLEARESHEVRSEFPPGGWRLHRGEAADSVYESSGQRAYVAHSRSRGEHSVAPWSGLVWADKLAWCEAARAAREAP